MSRLRSIFFPPSHGSFVHELRHGIPALLLISIVSFLLDYYGFLDGFESYALDKLLLFNSNRPESNLIIVGIDDDDYRGHFGGRSPIDPEKLAELLRAIAAGQPRVIGVDLETSDSSFAKVEFPVAVWARDGHPAQHDGAEEGSSHHGDSAPDIVRLDFLGGNFKEEKVGGDIETTPPSGLVIFPQDADGVVRRYRRQFHRSLSEPTRPDSGEVDSFPWAIVREYVRVRRDVEKADSCPECEMIDELRERRAAELMLNFAGDRYRFRRISAASVLQGAKQDYWKDKSPLRDAVVLVGGTYRAARDEYVTPVGGRYGVELVAQAVESDLRGGGIRKINHLLTFAMDIVTGLVLLYLAWRFPGRYSLIGILFGVVLLSLVASYIAFNAFAYWFNFSSVMLGLWIDDLWHKSQERRELKREVERLKAELRGEKPNPAGGGH